LQSFRHPAVEVCSKTIPDFFSVNPKQPPGVLTVTFAQGKINALDTVWAFLEDMFTEPKEVEDGTEQKTE
jgi:hypothetical protein